MPDPQPTPLRDRNPPPLRAADWTARADKHFERVQRWTLPHRQRRSRHEKHPVLDFLFEYYMFSAAKLETWHPAPTESLEDSPEARRRFASPEYRAVDGVIVRDPSTLSPEDIDRLAEIARILRITQSRTANFGCYGIHEWAMVYRGRRPRHDGTASLRLTQEEVDRFVDERPVACSHFDAFRFFAEDAKPLNRIPLEWSTRHEMEQPGCIHANMDLYRWAYTAMPWVGSDVLFSCFELAAELRVLDMQASPYDLNNLGLEPVRVETPAGRRDYQRRQRLFSERAEVLREELARRLEDLISACERTRAGSRSS